MAPPFMPPHSTLYRRFETAVRVWYAEERTEKGGKPVQPASIDRALIYLGRIATPFPAIQTVVGYLLADPERVRFVRRLHPDQPLAMAISAHRRIELPVAPWQGYIRGVPVPDPYAWIDGARRMGAREVWVRVSTDDPRLTAWVEGLATDDSEQVEQRALTARMEELRGKVDQVLDIYNELRHLLTVDPERAQDLGRFVNMAEDEMQSLGRELNHLKERLGEVGS